MNQIEQRSQRAKDKRAKSAKVKRDMASRSRAIRRALSEGKVSEAEAIFQRGKKTDKANQDILKRVWRLALEEPLKESSRDWLQQKLPFEQAVAGMLKEDKQRVKLADYATSLFGVIAKTNRGLIDELSRNPDTEYAWEALNGVLSQPGPGDRRGIGLWDRLLHLVKTNNPGLGKSPRAVLLLSITIGLRASNWLAVRWGLTKLKANERGEYVALCLHLAHLPGYGEPGTAGNEAIAKALENITDPKWQEYFTGTKGKFGREDLGWEHLRAKLAGRGVDLDAVRAKLERDHLDEVLPGKQGKAGRMTTRL